MARIFVSVELPDGGYRDCIQQTCMECGKPHDKVWLIRRKVEPWGNFGVAAINGKREVIDASLPTVVAKIPRGAYELDPEHLARVWHEDNESHVFGGPNVAKALREAIRNQPDAPFGAGESVEASRG